MHFISSDLPFEIFDKLWGFSKLIEFCEIFGMGFVKMALNHPVLLYICIITLFHAF